MSVDYVDLARLHAPLLLIVAPLAGAALAASVPGMRLSWALASLAALFGAIVAFDLAARGLLSGAIPAAANEGIALRLDGVGVWSAALIAAAGALTMIAAGASVRRDTLAQTSPFAFALLLVMIAGWSAAALAADFVALFAAVETAWLASIGVLALSAERSRGALHGALRMLVSGAVAAAMMLLGIGLLGRGAGSLELAALANAPIAAPGLAAAGAGLLLAGLALKAGVAPLHLWTGPAYGRAGGMASLALAAVGAIGALCVLVRVAALALSAPSIAGGLSSALLVIGIASVLIGSVQAVGARNVRRLVAYAGAAQAGCMLISVALGSPAGFAAALVQVLAQCVAALAVLGGATSVAGANTMAELDGLGRRAPLASAAITAGALSLMGAPLTLGFLGRWRLIEAGVGGGWWWAASAVIVASLAAVLYGGRLIERMYFRRAEAVSEQRDAWQAALAPALIVSILAIAIGFEPSIILRAADAAAATLVGEVP